MRSASPPPSAVAPTGPLGHGLSRSAAPPSSAFVRAALDALAQQMTSADLQNEVRRASNQVTSTLPFVRVEGLQTLIRHVRRAAAGTVDPATGHIADTMLGFGRPPGPPAVLRALELNLISPLFHRIFPRRELALALAGAGGLPLPELPVEALLQWTPLTTPATLLQQHNAATHRKAPDEPAMPPAERLSVAKGVLAAKAALSDTSLDEQEVALRLVQGLCVLVPSQKAHVADSAFFPMAVEAFYYCLLHIQQLALAERELRGRCADVLAAASKIPLHTDQGGPLQHSRTCSRELDDTDMLTVCSDSSTATAAQLGTLHTHTVAAAAASRLVVPPLPPVERAVVGQEQRLHVTVSGGGTLEHPEVVTMRPELLAVMVALVDAVEAACHYAPRCLSQLVHLHGARHMLALASCPYTPVILRCAVFDAVSLLMREADPYRRAVLAGDGGDAALPPLTAPNDAKGALHFSMDRAAASKLDSAVRSWLSANHLHATCTQLLTLRDVAVAVAPTMTRAEAQRIAHRASRNREKVFTDFLADVNARLIATIPRDAPAQAAPAA